VPQGPEAALPVEVEETVLAEVEAVVPTVAAVVKPSPV
jgi:hypothetical protein